jgi:hypothetical protein
LVAELAGKVPGPESQVTLCGFEPAQLKVTVPALTVSGVGVNVLSLTVMVVLCPPPPPPAGEVELEHDATTSTPTARPVN